MNAVCIDRVDGAEVFGRLDYTSELEYAIDPAFLYGVYNNLEGCNYLFCTSRWTDSIRIKPEDNDDWAVIVTCRGLFDVLLDELDDTTEVVNIFER